MERRMEKIIAVAVFTGSALEYDATFEDMESLKAHIKWLKGYGHERSDIKCFEFSGIDAFWAEACFAEYVQQTGKASKAFLEKLENETKVTIRKF